MKKNILKIFVLLLVLLCQAYASNSTVTVKDYEEINAVLNQYLEGASNGSHLLKPIFLKNAIMNAEPVQLLFDGVDKAGVEKNSKARVDILGVAGNIATARVVLENWHGKNFIDFHQLMKTEDGWKIVSKIYDQYECVPHTSIKEYDEILAVLNKYVEGGNNNSQLLKPLFHKNALMNDKPIQNLYDAIDQAGIEKNAKAKIDILDVSGNIATARVVLENWHGKNFIDFHQLMKTDDGWKIVSKIYSQY